MAQDFIANRTEAIMCVTWPWLFLAGMLLSTFVTPYGAILVVLAAVDAALLLWRVARRVRPANRRLLGLWVTYKGQHQAWRFLFGKPTPPISR